VRLSVSDAGAVTLRADASGAPAAAAIVAQADGLRLAFAGPAVVYERRAAMPRVRWMANARVVPSAPELLRQLKVGVPPNTVLLAAAGPGASGRDGRVRVTSDTTDAMTISVDAQGAGYVEIADDLQHGWKATIDGRPAPLVPADHALVAVPTPAGRHELKLSYHPKGFKPGVLISIASVLLTLAALGAGRGLRLLRGKEETS